MKFRLGSIVVLGQCSRERLFWAGRTCRVGLRSMNVTRCSISTDRKQKKQSVSWLLPWQWLQCGLSPISPPPSIHTLRVLPGRRTCFFWLILNFIFPVLLIYSWHKSLCKLRHTATWSELCMLWYNDLTEVSLSPPSHTGTMSRQQEIMFSSWWELFRVYSLNSFMCTVQQCPL